LTKTDTLIPQLRSELGTAWIPQIYEEIIRPMRTRSYELNFPERENAPEILHTLLGIELKVGKNRIACPDLATARYLAVFARIGCRSIAVPYDITKLSALADELETSWHRLKLVFESVVSDGANRRSWSTVIKSLRNDLNAIGAGTKMPLFNRSTKQRAN